MFGITAPKLGQYHTDAATPTMEPATMRADITMEEHNLLMAVRQLRDAETAQADAAAALIKAENDNEDAEWELSDAEVQYATALTEAKSPNERYDWAADLRRELDEMGGLHDSRNITHLNPIRREHAVFGRFDESHGIDDKGYYHD